MKKVITKIGMLTACVALGLTMFGCSQSVDSLLDDFEKACANKDIEKVTKIENKLVEKKSEMTQEQLQRFSEINWNCAADAVNDAKSAMDDMGMDD